MKDRLWLLYAIITTLFWGVWGAFIEKPEKAGFPATLGYVVWALTMIIPAIIALRIVRWKLVHDTRSLVYGGLIGFLGAGGQLILFTKALTEGPAFLIFPIISLSPVITILLSCIFLKERAGKPGWAGIALAFLAIPLLSYKDPDLASVRGYLWLASALLVFAAWGVQAYFMKRANQAMSAESIFFYMMVTGLLLIPVALWMTDFSRAIEWGLKGPWLAALIQMLNSIGALCLVYAFRYGKAIIVSPMTNALAPVITVILSLVLYQVFPHWIIIVGMVLAIASAFLLALDDARPA